MGLALDLPQERIVFLFAVALMAAFGATVLAFSTADTSSVIRWRRFADARLAGRRSARPHLNYSG